MVRVLYRGGRKRTFFSGANLRSCLHDLMKCPPGVHVRREDEPKEKVFS